MIEASKAGSESSVHLWFEDVRAGGGRRGVTLWRARPLSTRGKRARICAYPGRVL